jgi:hypothetical protein
MLVITFFSGLILAGIGVVGEYVARIIAEVTGPPRYTLRETTDKPEQELKERSPKGGREE